MGRGGGVFPENFNPRNPKIIVCFYWSHNYFPILILGNSIWVLGFTYNNTRIWRDIVSKLIIVELWNVLCYVGY